MAEPPLMRWDEMAVVGRIVRPHGNRGEVVVEAATDFGEDRFRAGARLHLEASVPRAIDVRSCREHDGRWILGLVGIATIDDAEALRGRELRIPAEELRPLEPGWHYVHDLVGCRVETVGGRRLGAVEDVRLDTGVALLVVNGEAGEVLVPFTAAFCRRVDTEGKTIVVDPPEGLVELNAAGSQAPAEHESKAARS